mgnify:CR=1 FL=1
MQTIDWIMIAIVGLGAVVGFSKGFIRQLASVVGLVAGLLVARALYASVGEKLAMETGPSLTFARGLAFLLIWLVVPVRLSLAATLLTKAVDSIHLGFVNRWLGAGLGALKYILLISLVIALIEYIDIQSNAYQDQGDKGKGTEGDQRHQTDLALHVGIIFLGQNSVINILVPLKELEGGL